MTRPQRFPTLMAIALAATGVPGVAQNLIAPNDAALRETTDAPEYNPTGAAPSFARNIGPIGLDSSTYFRYTTGDDFLSGPGRSDDVTSREIGFGFDGRIGEATNFSYNPSWRNYSGGRYEDQFSHRFSADGTANAGGWVLGLRQTYSDTAYIATETAQQTETESYGTRLSGDYPLNSILSGGLEASFDFRDSEAFNSSEVRSLGARISHSPRSDTVVSGMISAGAEETNTNFDADFIQFSGTFSHQPSEFLYVSAMLGHQERSFNIPGAPDLDSLIYSASLNFTPAEFTEISIRSAKTVGASLFTEQTRENESLSAHLRQRLFDILTLSLGYGESSSDYLAALFSNSPFRTDDFEYVDARLSLEALNNAAFTLFFRDQKNDSDDPLFGYDGSQYGIEARLSF